VAVRGGAGRRGGRAMDPLLAEKHAQDPKVYEEVMGFADYLGFDLAAFPELYWIAEQVCAPSDPRRSALPRLPLPSPSVRRWGWREGGPGRAGWGCATAHGPRCLPGRQPVDGRTPPPIHCSPLTSLAGVPRGGRRGMRRCQSPGPSTRTTAATPTTSTSSCRR
jgi:hypothetical protein